MFRTNSTTQTVAQTDIDGSVKPFLQDDQGD